MAKLFTVVLAFAMITAQASLSPSSTQLLQSNYSGLKSFIEGLMRGYKGESYKLPEVCLSQRMVEILDEDIVAIVESIIGLREENAIESYQILLGDLTAMTDDCEIENIAYSFNRAINQGGLVTMMTNIVWHMTDIQQYLEDSYTQFLTSKWNESGLALGKALAVIVPSASQSFKLFSSNDLDLQFVEGFINALDNNPKSDGTCHHELDLLFDDLNIVYEDFMQIASSQNFILLPTLINHGKKLYTDSQTIPDDCDGKGLAKVMQKIMGPNGMETLSNNYWKNMDRCNVLIKQINSGDVKNQMELGELAGELFTIVIGWGLPQNVS